MKRKKPEVHLYLVMQSNDPYRAEHIYAESPREALKVYLKYNNIFLMDDEASINVTDLGIMKDPDDRPK